MHNVSLKIFVIFPARPSNETDSYFSTVPFKTFDECFF